MASRNDERFLDDFYGKLAADLNLLRALPVDLPARRHRPAAHGRRKEVHLRDEFQPRPGLPPAQWGDL